MAPLLPDLPVHEALPALREALRQGRGAVLEAPPGAGKTTLVPLALLDEPWLAGQKIVMLEPRRLATRAAAHRMATILGEPLPQTVGYRVRGDTRVGPATRIEVVTEGVLTRMLSSDPTLDGIGLVIFDEYHERSLHADAGLALTLHSRALVRDELRVLVMSATLDGDRVAALLGGAPRIVSQGKLWPVDLRYSPARDAVRVEQRVASAIRTALRDDVGDVLAFLPGQGEIARTALQLGDLGATVDVHQLYGDLSFDDQDRAVAPAPAGRRKVVLATSIAESSLTIDGVRIVIDAGLARQARFSPNTGMTRLETTRVSRASADQRAGRAGRLAAGVCYRLWDAAEHTHLLSASPPEILQADLAPVLLELAVAGVCDMMELSWLDIPARGLIEQAQELLRWLGAVDVHMRATDHGRAMAQLGTHPRLAHMLLLANASELGATACDIAALLDERDVLRADGPEHDADVRLRLDLLRAFRQRERLPNRVSGMRVVTDAVRRAADSSREWRRTFVIAPNALSDSESAGRVLALAYPDRVAQRRKGKGQRYLLRNGTGAALRDSPSLAESEYLVVAESDGKRPEAHVYLAASLGIDDVLATFGGDVVHETLTRWDENTATVRASARATLGAIVLREVDVRSVDAEVVAQTLMEAIARSRLALLPWSESTIRLRERLAFLHTHDAAWPSVSDDVLVETLDVWLFPYLHGVRTRAQLEALDVGSLLLNRMAWSQRSQLDEVAPATYAAPIGSRHVIDYSDPSHPVVRVRLQSMFGCLTNPRVLGGAVPLTLHLLSPAQRPVQVTQDLAGFWKTSYFDVRKDMKGRYPKHNWPEDPLVRE